MQLDRKPSKCVVFEDDPRGITAAHNCTMMAVALIGAHPAWVIINLKYNYHIRVVVVEHEKKKCLNSVLELVIVAFHWFLLANESAMISIYRCCGKQVRPWAGRSCRGKLQRAFGDQPSETVCQQGFHFHGPSKTDNREISTQEEAHNWYHLLILLSPCNLVAHHHSFPSCNCLLLLFFFFWAMWNYNIWCIQLTILTKRKS